MTAQNRPRRSRGVVVMLGLLTLGNLVSTLLVVIAWSRVSAHGGGPPGLLVLGTVTAIAALVGLGGAWAIRQWGPWLLLAAVVVERVAFLVAMPEHFSVTSLGIVGLAIVLVWTVAREWR